MSGGSSHPTTASWWPWCSSFISPVPRSPFPRGSATRSAWQLARFASLQWARGQIRHVGGRTEQFRLFPQVGQDSKWWVIGWRGSFRPGRAWVVQVSFAILCPLFLDACKASTSMRMVLWFPGPPSRVALSPQRKRND